MYIPSTFSSFINNNSGHSKKLFYSKVDKNFSSSKFDIFKSKQAVYYKSVSKTIKQIYYN